MTTANANSTGAPSIAVQPALRDLRPYARAAMPPWIDLRLDANEGTPPPPSVLDPASLLTADNLCRYPSAARLESQLAERLGVDPERIIVTAGGDEAIDRVCRARLAPRDEAILTSPTFEMIGRYASLAGAALIPVNWTAGPFPTDEVIARASARTALIAVVSPNNPTGLTATAEDLLRLSSAAPHAVLLVDLAYTEFADEDLTSAAARLPNAVIIRTFSKAWGLAGLRIGYAIGPARFVDAMRATAGPYPVPGPSIAAALNVLDRGESWLQSQVAGVRRSRARLTSTLRPLGATVTDSQGNFILARSPRSAWLANALRSLGIAVRSFAPGGHLADALRITCPTSAAETDRVERAIASALAPQAILFDMDGVLADVSGSYRRAIAVTAAHFGITITPADIAAAKARGNANNDWQLTLDLVRSRGGRAELPEVIREFQRAYEGDSQTPGLRDRETLIPDRAWLRRLATRLPLGIVTGRPRAEAAEFLARQGIADLFRVVVCMEDGPAKPDPAPVRSALARLGVGPAWLIGDTVDDLRAARAADVVPIAIPAPGDNQNPDPLLAAGPAALLERLEQLEELLP